MRRSIGFGFGLLSLLLAPRSALAADVSVVVYADYITRTIEGAVSDFIDSNGSTFAWLEGVTRVEASASGVDETTAHLRLNLAFLGLLDPLPLELQIVVDADVPLTCDSSGPDLSLRNVQVSPMVFVPDDALAQVTSEANRMLDEQADKIIGPLWKQLGNMRDLANVHKVCPHVEVSPNGDIHAELNFIDGCINGTRKHTNCNPGYWGHGISRECGNGLWITMEHDCTPNGAERP
jgi:hypothetical protein